MRHREAAAEAGAGFTPFPSLQLTEAEAELASIELCGDQGWKRRLAKVRRRPRPADNYAKGCVCAGSSK